VPPEAVPATASPAALSLSQPSPVPVPLAHLQIEVLRRPVESTAYTSLAFSQRITELELHQSLGKTGDCYDNAAVEAFFATLKRELAWIHHAERWNTKDQLRGALFDYIEDFYNPQRIQQRLGHQSPIDFERAVS